MSEWRDFVKRVEEVSESGEVWCAHKKKIGSKTKEGKREAKQKRKAKQERRSKKRKRVEEERERVTHSTCSMSFH